MLTASSKRGDCILEPLLEALATEEGRGAVRGQRTAEAGGVVVALGHEEQVWVEGCAMEALPVLLHGLGTLQLRVARACELSKI